MCVSDTPYLDTAREDLITLIKRNGLSQIRSNKTTKPTTTTKKRCLAWIARLSESSKRTALRRRKATSSFPNMHVPAQSSAACVVHCVRSLPTFPFHGVTAVVSRLTLPPAHAPPVDALCAGGVTGFSVAEGATFCRAAAHLHPRHKLPFVLSRVAASHAIAALPRKSDDAQDGGQSIVFTGSRTSARDLHGCELSLSHEDCIAAALAWAQPHLRSSAHKSEAAGLGCTRRFLRCAVDVCPVAEVHRVRRRFPQLGRRWMPQCVTDASSDTVYDALTAMASTAPDDCVLTGDGQHTSTAYPVDVRVDAELLERRQEWWRHLTHPCSSQSEAYASVVLAQHWAARECAVKLFGISGRAFPYASLQRDPSVACDSTGPSILDFTPSFMPPHRVCRSVVCGSEKAVWQRRGLDPTVHLYSWVEWCPSSNTVDVPYIVVAACCSADESFRSI